ncbi:hypothetical protein LCM20_09105 [Halobacillus litoralis]|uniref:SA1320 family protein n=1 Tax=Halobacillus litoralis TaxID=45668 RepID=UPI001CD7A5F9|nr:hypothetical protein [Halobacillus litoralis]MCA0970745.1 hypothetical protein [Halobacillus litoralis]
MKNKPNWFNDRDLVELAGYNAYKSYGRTETIIVNNNKYMIKDKVNISESGLDAYTISNVEMDSEDSVESDIPTEYAIIYAGTNKEQFQDLSTDAQLIGSNVPQQLSDAKNYFDRMEKRFGKISYVAGNSLGGALTNAIAVEEKSVHAVTLNPAILPKDLVDQTQEHTNITNYFSKYDVLTGVEESINLDYRIPGKVYRISSGVPHSDHLLSSNHTGYLSKEMSQQFIRVGEKGEPGYGKIYIGSDEHIVTSVWTGVPLYGGQTDIIDINSTQLTELSEAVQGLVTERLSLASSYLGHSIDIVDHEASLFHTRLEKLKQVFTEMVDGISFHPALRGLTVNGNAAFFEQELIASKLDEAEQRYRGLNTILNSPPFEIAEFVFDVDISVESIFAYLKELVYNLGTLLEEAVGQFLHIKQQIFPQLFEGGTDAFYDAVVGELDAHYEVIQQNKEKMMTQISQYGTQVLQVGENFEARDRSVGQSIQTGATAVRDVEALQKTEAFDMTESDYLGIGLLIREQARDSAFDLLKQSVHVRILPLLTTVDGVLGMMEQSISTAKQTIRMITVQATNSLPMKLIGLFNDFDDKVRAYVNDALQPLDEMEDMVEGLQEGVTKLAAHLPELLERFQPYIETALFEGSQYENVRLYNVSATVLLEEMIQLFDDIVRQLSAQKANAIDTLADTSRFVSNNLAMLRSQIDRGTM